MGTLLFKARGSASSGPLISTELVEYFKGKFTPILVVIIEEYSLARGIRAHFLAASPPLRITESLGLAVNI
jgi:hypothetical protein